MIGFLVFWIREALRAKVRRVSKPDVRPLFDDQGRLQLDRWMLVSRDARELPTWTKAGWTWSSRLEPGPVSSATSSERIREEPSVAVDRTSVR